MKLKFSKMENGEYHSRILRGKGGISSCVSARIGGFWFALSLFFKMKPILKALKNRH